MISLKKQLVKQELDTLFNNYPIVVWYQTKQKSTREWTRLKEKVKALTPSDESTLKTVQTKTAILKVVLKSKVKDSIWLRTCQEQLLVCGCTTSTDLKNLLTLLNSEKDGFVVGGFYGDLPCTFMEIEKLQTLGTHTYIQLIQSLQSVMVRFLMLKRLCDFSYLRHVNVSLCHTLKQCGHKSSQ